MKSLPAPFRPVSLSPGDEVLELRDVGAANCTPTQDADAFPPDECPSDEDWARMEAHNVAHSIGYTEAVCAGCGCVLFVPIDWRCGEVLCTECLRTGNALAAEEDGDDEPTPPANAEPIPARDDPEYFGPIARRLDDNALVCGVHIADAEPHRLGLDTAEVQAAALSAFTAEVLRRLDVRKAA